MFSSQNSQVSNGATYIEDVFSTYLYTGNGATRDITNNIDNSTKGGLVWIKARTQSQSRSHFLFDTERGDRNSISSNSTSAQTTQDPGVGVLQFNTNGFSVGAGGICNDNTYLYASWNFRKQPKFFDIVTYTGNGTAGRTIAHNLGSVPGCIIVKDTSTSALWAVYHRSLTSASYYMELNTTVGQAANSGYWNGTAPTSSVFTLGNDGDVNGSGRTYVAYLFAHDAGGFGLTGTDNVISCGSFTKSSGVVASITLGYEPQWLLFKRTDTAENWFMIDNMRGMTMSTDAYLIPNLSNAEANLDFVTPTATGFEATNNFNNGTYIYIAIRRGPMKVPTSGTSVFVPTKVTGSAIGQTYSIGFPSDLFFGKDTSGASYVDWVWQSRLTGDKAMSSDSTSAESITAWGDDGVKWTYQNSIYIQSTGYLDTSPILYTLRRAPSFFDEVCYTGTSPTPQNINHNLGVAPELMIVKVRSVSGDDWVVYCSKVTDANIVNLRLNKTQAIDYNGDIWDATTPTATTFRVGQSVLSNYGSQKLVAYLFATCAGVSKVGSYTGTGTTKQIDCGFTGGARFVLIKRTDSTGDWYVWDTARGIVSGNDPYLLLNSTAAETTTTDYIDTYSAGFEISSTAPAAINASGGTFIFLAIA